MVPARAVLVPVDLAPQAPVRAVPVRHTAARAVRVDPARALRVPVAHARVRVKGRVLPVPVDLALRPT